MWNAFSNYDYNIKKKLLVDAINSEKFSKGWGKFLANKLEEYVFVCGQIKKGRKIYDIKMDLMKFIKISDALPTKASGAVYPANLYLSDKDVQGQTNAQEVIDFNSEFLFDIKINEEELRKINELANKTNSEIWLDFSKKFFDLFGFYIQDVNQGELESKIIDSIKNKLLSFSKNIIKYEKDWLSNISPRVYSKDGINIAEVIDIYSKFPAGKIIGRLGWGSGFISTTLFSALHQDEQLHNYLMKIMEKFKIGVPRNRKEVNPPNLEKFPKSKRFAAQNMVLPFSPFGWFVILNEDQNYNIDIEIKEARVETIIDDPEPEKIFSEEEAVKRNSERKYSKGDILEAKYIDSEGKFVTIELLDSSYADMTFSFKYANTKILKDKIYFNVKITEIKDDKINYIQFAGFLK